MPRCGIFGIGPAHADAVVVPLVGILLKDGELQVWQSRTPKE
jgi:hypothetical protein